MAKNTRLSDEIGHFTGIPNDFIQNSSSFSSHAFRLFVLLRFHTFNKTGTAFPDYAQLRLETGLCNATIAKALRELISAGWLTREKRFGKPVEYRLTFPSRAQQSSTEQRTDSSLQNRDQFSTEQRPVLYEIENNKEGKTDLVKTDLVRSKPTPSAVRKIKTQSQIPVHPEQTFRLDSVINHLALIYQLPLTSTFHERAYLDAAETVCRLVRPGGEIDALTIYFDSVTTIPELKFLAQKFSQWAVNEKRKTAA